MKRVIITGSTGMIGGIVLRECLHSTDIEKVTVLVRKPTGLRHPKLNEIVVADFLDYSTMASHFVQQDVAYFCIGVYTGQVPDNEFKTITVDYTRAFADALKQGSPNATFCFLSGDGADQKEKSRMSFARYKGMAENYLKSKQFGQLYIFRPGYIYPVEKRREPNFSYKLMRMLYPMINAISPSNLITSEQLGKAMYKVGLEGADKVILENADIKRIVDVAEANLPG